MGQSEISFPIFGGIDDNENGFDQSSDFPELVPKMNERIQSLCRTLDQVFCSGRCNRPGSTQHSASDSFKVVIVSLCLGAATQIEYS